VQTSNARVSVRLPLTTCANGVLFQRKGCCEVVAADLSTEEGCKVIRPIGLASFFFLFPFDDPVSSIEALRRRGREDGGSLGRIGEQCRFWNSGFSLHSLSFSLIRGAMPLGAVWGEAFETFPEEAFDRVFNLNVKAIFLMTRACLPLLQKRASAAVPSVIVNMGSVAGTSVLNLMWGTSHKWMY